MFRILAFVLIFASTVCTFSQILDYQDISKSSVPSSNSKMIFDDNYNLHVTWIDSINQIFYRFREGEIWSEKILLYESDSTNILELSISSYHDTLSVFWVEKGNRYKIKSVRLPDKTVTQLYESELILQNIKNINNSSTNFITWLEEDYYHDVNIMDLNNLDTLTVGHTLTPFSYSVCW